MENGCRVLYLRPQGDYRGPGGCVARDCISITRIEPLRPSPREVMEAVGRAEIVVFTSPRAPLLLSRALGKEAWESLARALGGKSIAAIGARTAEALSSMGLEPRIVPESFSSEGLSLSLIRHSEKTGERRVLLLRSKQALRDLPQALVEGGLLVEEIPVYEHRVVEDKARLAAMLVEEGVYDVVVVSSPVIASGLCRFLKRSPGHTAWVAWGPATRRALLRDCVFLEEIHLPDEYSLEGVNRLVRRKCGC